MPQIPNNNNIDLTESTTDYWIAELKNLKILLYDVSKGITTILTSGISSYTLDTGQSSQSTKRLSLLELREFREDLLSQIDDIEKLLGIRKRTIQVYPGF